MIYRGTNFTERIQLSPMDRINTVQWIEMRRFGNDNDLEVFLCDDYGNRREVWSWWFTLDNQTTYEQIKFNIMASIFDCDTITDLVDALSEIFTDGFSDVLLSDDDCLGEDVED